MAILEDDLPRVAVSALPDWEPGTPGVLCVSGLHAIPISTALRAGDDRIVFALSSRRSTLTRLREDARTSFCLLGAGLAFTAYGEAAVIREGLEAAPHVVALELRVSAIQDHLSDGRTEIVAGARWRWRADRFVEDEQAILAELVRLI